MSGMGDVMGVVVFVKGLPLRRLTGGCGIPPE